MWSELKALWTSLGDAEYSHLLLESLPLYGLALGWVFLLGGYVIKDIRARLFALAIIAACSFSVGPYSAMRAKSMPDVLKVTDAAYHPLIQAQTERRTSSRWLYYTIAGVSIAAAALGHRGKGLFLIGVVVVLTSIGVIHSLWLHKKECEVFHRNLVSP
jgi:hypothetical protein